MIKLSFSTRIQKLERMVYKKDHPSTAEETLSDRLTSLEIELNIEQDGGSGMFSRMLTLKDTIEEVNQHFANIESKVFQGTHVHKRAEMSLFDRLNNLEKELGMEPSGQTLMLRIQNLKKGIGSTNVDIKWLEEQVYPKNAEMSLSFRLSKLEKELRLDHNDKNQILRISFLRKHLASMKTGISKLETKLYSEVDESLPNESIADRLFSLEEESGLDNNEGDLVQRLTALEDILL
eukprot:13735511-Ditylum_brightwellii.AAC.1